MGTLGEFGKRLTSRKFLVALGTAISSAAAGQWDVTAITVIGYLVAEGVVDASDAYGRTKALNTALDQASDTLDEVEKTLIAEHRALEKTHTEV